MTTRIPSVTTHAQLPVQQVETSRPAAKPAAPAPAPAAPAAAPPAPAPTAASRTAAREVNARRETTARQGVDQHLPSNVHHRDIRAGRASVGEGDTAPAIKDMQKQLNKTELAPNLPVTGTFSGQDRKVLEHYQQTRGLPVTGRLDQPTALALQDKRRSLAELQARDQPAPAPAPAPSRGFHLFGSRSSVPTTRSPEVNNALKRVDGSHGSIATARAEIKQHHKELSPDERSQAYEYLAQKVTYRNQRDNVGNKVSDPRKGDIMCNVTSMGMALNGLGLGIDESKGKQFEDHIDEFRDSHGLGSRYDENSRGVLAGRLGATDVKTVRTPSFKDGPEAKAWYQKNVLPKMQDGATATFGVADSGGFRHVIRMQWVEKDGLRVDDPFGAGLTYDAKSGRAAYRALNDQTHQSGVGNDNLMSWDDVAKLTAGRYVQLYNR